MSELSRLVQPLEIHQLDGQDVFNHPGPVEFSLGEAYKHLTTVVADLEVSELPMVWRGGKTRVMSSTGPTGYKKYGQRLSDRLYDAANDALDETVGTVRTVLESDEDSMQMYRTPRLRNAYAAIERQSITRGYHTDNLLRPGRVPELRFFATTVPIRMLGETENLPYSRVIKLPESRPQNWLKFADVGVMFTSNTIHVPPTRSEITELLGGTPRTVINGRFTLRPR